MTHSSNSRQITVAEMAPHVHSFAPGENKVNKISTWLMNWIEISLKNRKIKPYDLLPAKGDLAFHIGVSKGTIQNVFRVIEDNGFVESKQRIGTYISDTNKKKITNKLTSKREHTVEIIKRFIKSNNYKPGSQLPSTRKLSQITGISNTTIRVAIGSLISEGIIKKENNIFIINQTNFKLLDIVPQTLVEKISKNLKEYIASNYEAGDKLPANFEFARIFNVSVKTIHDAIKQLTKEGILQTRRGQYGTTVVDISNNNTLYHYEKIEVKIRHYIAKNSEVGVKLPSIVEFSELYKVSAKTIKKALDNLADEGYITFVRGRYGGTFVTDIPQATNEAYKWLALSPGYAPNIEN